MSIFPNRYSVIEVIGFSTGPVSRCPAGGILKNSEHLAPDRRPRFVFTNAALVQKKWRALNDSI
jgi:hypothetical protein